MGVSRCMIIEMVWVGRRGEREEVVFFTAALKFSMLAPSAEPPPRHGLCTTRRLLSPPARLSCLSPSGQRSVLLSTAPVASGQCLLLLHVYREVWFVLSRCVPLLCAPGRPCLSCVALAARQRTANQPGPVLLFVDLGLESGR